MDISLYGSLNSKLKSVASGIKNITFENGILIFTTNDDKIINVTVPNMHLHSNKNILDKFTVVDEKLYYDGRDLEVECHEHANKGVLDSITSTKVSEWNNKVDKANGKSLIDDTEIERLKNVVNYDDTDVKASIPTKVSQLTNDSDYATENFVTNKIAEASLGGGGGEVDLSGYQTKTDNALTTTAKTIVGAINENKSSLDDITTNKFDDISISGSILSLKANGNVKKNITLPTNSNGGSSNEYPLSGINWFNFGDSLSEFKSPDNNGVPYGWTDRASELTGATIKNCALAGSHIQDLVGVMANKGFANNDIATADIITIQNYGNNEFQSSVYPIGSIDDVADLNSTSTCSGLKGVIEYVQNLNPTAPIIFITEPLLYSKLYRPVLIQVCEQYCVDVLDLAVKCGFNVRNKSSWYLDDDTHLLGEGYKRWGELVSSYIVDSYGYVLRNIKSDIDTTNPIITLSTSNLTVNENATNTFTVKLDVEPENNVTVSLSASNSNITLSSQSLTFTSSNYNTPQIVTVTGVHNSESYVNLFSVITLKSDNLASKSVNVTITNIDVNPNPSTSYTTRGLQLDYNFVGGSGTSVADKTSNAKALTLTNCAWSSTGLVFNGSSSIGTATGTTTGNFIPTTEISFEAYFKPSVVGVTGDLIGRATMYQYALSYGEDGKTHFYIYDSSTTQNCVSVSNTTLNEYVHYVGTYNNVTGDMKLYKNGVLETTLNLSAKPTLPALAMDGGNYDYTVGGQNVAGHFFNGEIALVRYYNVELTQAEVTANYNAI